MHERCSNSELLTAWCHGDEHAATVLFERYLVRLTAFARARLSRSLSGRIDPEDVVLSAYRSFFIGARRGSFSASGDDLWPLLVTITLRKLTKQARSQTSARRTVLRETVSDEDQFFQEAVAAEPPPEHVIAISDEIQLLLENLDTRSREVMIRLLNGEDAATIARDLGCSDRTVRRIVEQVRHKLAVQNTADAELPESSIGGVLSRSVLEHFQSMGGDGDATCPPTCGFDQLVLHEMIGQGAFSKVFRATETATARTVAVKFLRKSLWQDSRAARGIQREFAALTQFRQPNVLSVYGWGRTSGGAIFLVSEYLQGHDLAVWRDQNHPTVAAIVEALISVAEGLLAAHAAGILHGDLKLQNVMSTTDGRIVLMDFGMARWFQLADDIPPRGGTAGFLSPEQISAAFGAMTVQTDVYAWGGLAYALLTGRPPTGGRDLPEVFANVLSSAPPVPIHSSNATVPAALEALVMRCLAKEQARRPANMREVLNVLQDFPIKSRVPAD